MLKLIRILTLFFTFSVLLFASNTNDLKKVSLQLNWNYQFEFAGFITAYEKGFYKDIGLDVEIKPFQSGLNIIDDVKNKKTTYGIYDLSVLEYYDEEKPLILLANYLKKSALVLVTKQDIITPHDLKNKIIMADEPQLKNSILNTLLQKFRVKTEDFKEIVPHTFSIEQFAKGEVDAMTAYVSNELYELKKSKIPFNIIDPSNFGLYSFSLNMFGLKEDALANPVQTRQFIEATNKGWTYALENKEEVVDIIYEKYSDLKSKEALLFEASEIEKLTMTNLYELGSIRENFLEEMLYRLSELELFDKNILAKDLIFDMNDTPQEVLLTASDKVYLKEKSEVRVCVDPDWMPYEKIKDGQHIGISKDYIDILEKELALKFTLLPTKTWTESLSKVKNRECDILSLAMTTKTREEYLNFTEAYITSPLVVATKVDELFIADIKSIISKKNLGIVKGYAFVELLRTKYPHNKIIEVSSVTEGLNKVVKGQLFGFVDTLSTVGYEIQNKYLGELKIAGKFDEGLNLGIGVRKDDQQLHSILNKMIANISEDQHHKILNKWINVKYDNGVDYTLLWQIVGFFIILFAVGFYRHKDLVQHTVLIEEQKKELKEKNDELSTAHTQLQQSLRSFQALFSSTMEAIFVLEDEHCIDANDIAVKLLGYESRDALLGENLLNHVDNYSYEILKENLHRDVDPYEVNIVKEDGTVIPTIVQGKSTIYNEKHVRIVTVVDVTELKHKEMLLFKQSKMASMGEMIGNIAHQWRQPLSVMSTISTGLKLKIDIGTFEKEDAIRSLDVLNETAQHLSQTIDDFKNFYQSDKEKTLLTVKELVDKNMALMETSFKAHYIDVIFDYEDPTKEVSTYRNELIQALVNILNNAKDACLLQDNTKKRTIFISSYCKDNMLVLSIKDNAGGIPSSIIDKIFEPYFTTKHKSNGTGIGLYMTHQIINTHIGGKIEVQNVTYSYNGQEQIGAEFLLFIPTF